MGTIHVNTDLMRQLGKVYNWLNDQIKNEIEPQIQSNTSALENDWQGVSQQRYDQLYQQWMALSRQLVDQGEQIGQHLQNTATQFEQADQ
jgi:WXG100 family type VII secretion target